MNEMKVEMAEHHVRKGGERVLCQRSLMETLSRHGHERMLPQAHRLLAEFKTVQVMSEEHLVQFQVEATEICG